MRNSSARVRRRKQRIAEMNVVPYIDVMLVLLIIFMTTSTFISEDKKLELPISNTGKEALNNPFLEVDAELNLSLRERKKGDSRRLGSIDEAIPILKALQKNAQNAEKFQILLTADKNVKYGNFLEFNEKLKKAGLKVSLVTNSYKSSK